MTRNVESVYQLAAIVVCCFVMFTGQKACGQSFGVELHNTLMPASGGMGGVSIAEPQDLLSAINGNPSTMSQFDGTQFTFGGGWAYASYTVEHTGNGVLPGLGPFRAGSGTPGSALANIGVTQDFQALGRRFTAGVALISTAGLGVDVVDEPNSADAHLTLQVLHLTPGVSIQLNDRLSVGANFGLGIGLFDGLFVGISKASSAYGARGSFGADYAINPCTKIGAYYQTKENFLFEDAIEFTATGPLDIRMDLPANIGIGVSNRRLANGRLLVAADFIYKFWQDALLFDALYENQFAIQLGAQYSAGRAKLRMGYVWTENPMVDVPGDAAGGIVPPGAVDAIQYIQSLAANINQHRISAGIGIPNVLPGVDLDMFGGGMFAAQDTFGLSGADVSSYFLGGGLTWRFNRGSGCNLAPNEWCPVNGRPCRGCSSCSSCN